MKTYKLLLLLPALLLALFSCTAQKSKNTTLKDAYKDKFFIGTALNLDQIHGKDVQSVEIVKSQFSSIVAENCMKSMYLQPEEGKFFFDDADKFVEFGEKNKMFIIGHNLLWHSQAPRWFFTDKDGKNVTPEVLKERIKNHITTIVTRYKGRIQGWDVVNEAILDDGQYRKSKFYEILGEEFIPLAFQYAHEADPDAELYYNDYNEWFPGKREAIVKLVKTLKEKGLRIDGIGMQSHLGIETPSLEEYEKAIITYSDLGIKASITELDVSALPSPWGTSANISDVNKYRKELDPYKTGLTPEAEKVWENRYLDLFKLYLKHQDRIRRVTLWGVTDLQSWKNDFPVRGRTDYPLLFDRNYNAKPLVQKLINLSKSK